MSAPIPRSEPYVWVTGLAKLLGGDTHCQWSLWFRGHYQFAKRPRDFDEATWTARHSTLVRDKAERLRVEGYEIYLVDQNRISVQGPRGILAGKPDIVAVRDGEAIVVDCKTGAQKVADSMQVLLYMLLLPRAHRACQGKVVAGELCYTDFAQTIEADELTPNFKVDVRKAFRMIVADSPPPRTPSLRDCKFCDITSADCPDRVECEKGSAAIALDLL
jgi:CRISPR/Cas system-associated exonuclease Cas4 (RecB family)